MTLLSTLFITACCSGAAYYGWAGTYLLEYTTQAEGEDPEDHVLLLVGSVEGNLVAYNLLEGRDIEWNAPLAGTLYGAPAYEDGYVYIATYDTANDASIGKLYKIEADSGDIESSVELDSNVVGGLAVASGTIYVGTSAGVMHALDTEDLTQKWQYPGSGALTDRIWGSSAVDTDAGVVYFGCFDQNFYALNTDDGTLAWDEPYEAGGAIAGKPLISGDNVYFGSFDRKFYAVDKTTGEAAWDTPFAAGNWFWTEAIADSGTIYVGCLDSKVYALDAASGTMQHSFTADSSIISSPVLAVHPGDDEILGTADDDEPVLVVATRNGTVYGLDPDDLSDDQWASQASLSQAVQSPMSVYGEFIYVYGYTSQSKLAAVRINNGTPAWTTTTGE